MNAQSFLDKLGQIPGPAYVADEAALRANLAVLANVKQQAGCKILYAIKACPLHSLFGIMAETLDGSTASGLYEARLGHEEFGKETHVFCPAYTEAEMQGLLSLGVPVHVYFNSIEQVQKFGPQVRAAGQDHEIGLRVNPGLSVTTLPEYDPCRQGSHLGVPLAQLDAVPWDLVDALHAHILCQNMAEHSAQLIDHVADKLGAHVPKVRHVNFGGGHYITDPAYKTDLLVDAIKRFRARYRGVGVVLEPGAALVLNAGYLVGSVLAVQENEGVKTAILDVSPNCHVPDVLKAHVRMAVMGAGEEGERGHDYVLSGRTCMARDIWGTYSFTRPLTCGDRIVFEDGLQYSLGEANWFNGHPRPELGLLRADGSYESLRSFGYEDFKRDCGRVRSKSA